MHDTEGETIDDVRRQRDEAIAWIEDYKADHLAVIGGQCAGDERHCSCVPHLRNALDELGIQLAALQDRLRLAMAVVDAARAYRDEDEVYLDRALAAFDEVPGDTLERP